MSVRPAVGPAELEILGIRLRSHAGLLRLLKAEGNAVTRRVSDRFLFGGEAHADLRPGIGRAGPAHQGIDLLGRRLGFALPCCIAVLAGL